MIKRRLIISAVLISLVLALVLGACAQPAPASPTAQPTPTAPAAAPLEFVYASYILGTDQSERTRIWWFDEIEKRSGGRITFKKHFTTLGGAMDMLPLVRSGAVDIADMSPAYFAGELPIAAGPAGLYVHLTEEEALRAVNRLLTNPETEAILNAEAAKHNTKMLNWIVSPHYYLQTRKPVNTLADIKGMKLRSMGEWLPKVLTEVGAIPVSVLPAEWYDSLAKGVIDGIPTSISYGSIMKLYEVAKYASFTFGASGGSPAYINLNSWKKLPADIQKLMIDVWQEAIEFELKILAEDNEKARLNYTWAKVSEAEQKQIMGLWKKVEDQWVESLKAKGLGTEAQKLVTVWRAERAKFGN